MASRQDQLHSYQFSVQRVVAALVLREPDPAQSPGRRLGGVVLAGLLLAALSLAGVAVFGVISPGGGGDSWRNPGTVIVERESGARFVYLDGALYPVLNYASARLLAGEPAHTTTVAASRLAGVPRGAPLGIPGAPDSLPANGSLLTTGWSVCSARLAGSTRSVLFVGTGPAGGRALGEQALLTQTPDGTLYLVWHGSALRVPQPQLVRSAFSWGGEPAVPVAPALIDALPGGPDLAPPVIPGAGAPATALPGLRVGTILVAQTQGGAREYGVVLVTGLAPISQVQADLLLSDPAGAGSARQISQAQFAQAPVAALGTGDGLPPTTPALAHPVGGAAVCAAVPDGAPATLTVDAAVPAAAPASVTGATAAPVADRVVVPPGRGALVAAVASDTAPSGALCLVTDLGRRFPLPSAEVAQLLGYTATAAVRIPAALVAMLPEGPVLDPAAARQPA